MKIFNSVFTLTFIWLARIGGVRAHTSAHTGLRRLLRVLRSNESAVNGIYHVCPCRWNLKHIVFHPAAIHHVFYIKFTEPRGSVSVQEQWGKQAGIIHHVRHHGSILGIFFFKCSQVVFFFLKKISSNRLPGIRLCKWMWLVCQHQEWNSLHCCTSLLDLWRIILHTRSLAMGLSRC